MKVCLLIPLFHTLKKTRINTVGKRRKQNEEMYKEIGRFAMKDEILWDAFAQWEGLSLTKEQRSAYLIPYKASVGQSIDKPNINAV